VERYHLTNVKTIAAAVCDRQAMIEMEVPRYWRGGENLYEAAIFTPGKNRGGRKFTVPSLTIDSICTNPVHFIKCDVEGHEEAVIRGANRTIESFQPAWLVEVSKHVVVRTMKELNYRPFWFDGTALRMQKDTDHPVNSFFLNDTHLEILENNGMRLI
jgi:FkbM family methyltransferase